jgi:polar amino acid transport system substrate-binding protein
MNLTLKACLSFCIITWISQTEAKEYRVDLIQENPWAFQNPVPSNTAPYAGIIVDLLSEFEKRSGHKIKTNLTPSIRAVSNLKNGRSDFSIMAWNKKHEQYANQGTFLFPIHIGIRARKDISIIRYDDLKKITTSIPRGLDIDAEFDADQSLKKDLVQDYMTGIKKTAANRDSQAVGGSLSTINYTIKKLGLINQFGDSFLLGTTQLAVHFSKKSPLIKDEKSVNAIFKAMLDDGTVREIHSKWMD